ncbi:MAG: NTP transferase domain-containing protein, partial [archaeon]|nr:NTP transferase domain-containing protein [archaeon]
MTVDKKEIPVVILAAGEAKRLKPLSNQIIKPIVPINGIPLINRVIENYYDNGFEKFYIVISPEEKGIKNTVSEFELVKNNKVFAEFLIQQEAKGMADAILTTYEKVKDHKCFIVTAADVLYEKETPTLMLEKHIENESYLTLSLIYSEDEKMSVGHGNCVLKENHMVEKIIEKPGPEKKIGNYYSMPTYIFSTEFFNAIKHVKTSERGEYEIQDAIVLAIKNNKKVLGVNILPKMKNFKFKNVGAYH